LADAANSVSGPKGADWTADQVAVVVANYFIMLNLERAGGKAQKSGFVQLEVKSAEYGKTQAQDRNPSVRAPFAINRSCRSGAKRSTSISGRSCGLGSCSPPGHFDVTRMHPAISAGARIGLARGPWRAYTALTA
jgi:hypothetical protein